MLRFYYVIIRSIFWIISYFSQALHIIHHPDRYTEEQKYAMAKKIVYRLEKNSRIVNHVEGLENLPQEGSYVMYPNHQGKWDGPAIVRSHPTPCTVMMDARRSKLPLADEFVGLLGGCRLDKSSPRAQVESILHVTEDLKAGRRYIIFPEGGYVDNRNHMREFLPGAFKCALQAKVPIVPTVLIDTYKPYSVSSLKKVDTYVIFLPPIYPEEYKGKNTREVSEEVKARIQKVLEERLPAEEVGPYTGNKVSVTDKY